MNIAYLLPVEYYAFSGLVNLLAASIISLLTFLSNRKSNVNKIFSLFSFAVAYWSLFYFIWLMSKDAKSAGFYLRSCMIGVLFMPSLFIHFVILFLKIGFDRKLIVANYILSVLFTLTVYTPLYAKEIGSHLVFPYWLRPGPVFHIALVHFGTVILYSFHLMWKAIKKEKGDFRNQILYVFVGTAIGYISGITNYFCWYRINIPPFLNIAVSVYVIMIAAAIIRYRLMNIQLLSRNITGWLFTGLLSVLPFGVAAALARILWLWPEFIFTNGPGPVICCVADISLALAMFTIYQNPQARRLCYFSILLGVWNFASLFLCVPQNMFSVWFYRFGYGVGCLVIIAWLYFWRGCFSEEVKDKRLFAGISRWATRSACIVFPFAGFTPLVVKSLFFDSEPLTTAAIIPGLAHWPFSLWFLTMVVVAGIAPVSGWWKSKEANKRQIGFWMFGSFLLAVSAAATYFLFVQGKCPWYWYPILEFLLILFLAGALVSRMPLESGQTRGTLAWQLGRFGLSILIFSFVVGFLVAQRSWLAPLGGFFGGLFLVYLLKTLHQPVQEWVDQTCPFRKEFGHIVKAIEAMKKEWNLDSLEEALPLVARGVLETTPYRACTIAIMFDEQPKRPFFRSTYLRLAHGELIPGTPWSEPLVLAFLRLVRQNGNLCLREEIENLPPTIGELEPLLFEAAVPLTTNSKIVGVVVMGPKEGRTASFHDEDVKILNTLAQTLSQRLGPSVGLNLFRCVVNNTLHDVLGQDIGPLVDKLSLGYPVTQDMTLGGLRKTRDVLKELRAYAQGELEKGRAAQPDMFNIEYIIKGVYELHRDAAGKKGLKFNLKIPVSLPSLRLDSILVERCIANLVTNAIKYTLRGAIEISVQANEKFLVVCVADTGIGIPKESQQRIFEAGYRVPGDFALIAEGSGIGLANVQDLMIALGGRVEVESEFGRGSRFCLNFPLPVEITEIKAVA